MTGREAITAFLRQLPVGDLPQSKPFLYPLPLDQIITVGRDLDCQIVLDSQQYGAVSRRHAEIRPQATAQSRMGLPVWWICDLNSANGTYVNGQRLQGCQVLQVGDRILLGQHGPEFVFEQHSSRTSPSLPARPAVSQVASSPVTLPRSSARSPVESVTLTQLFPIFSTGRDLTQKAYLVPGIVTVSFVVLMFAAVGEPVVFNLVLAAYLSAAAYYFVYRLCGKHKPWWVLLGVAFATALILISPILSLAIWVFREVLPGNIPEDTDSISFPLLLITMFFGAGLMEELLKALPVLVALFLGKALRSPWRERLGVWEPLDGILLGAAAAVGFTLLETLGQYVPDIVQNATLQAGQGLGQLVGLQLLIPRILGSVAGHMAYSGYLGYFIGLSVLKPGQRWAILGVGYLTAAGLHALWNAAGSISGLALAVIGGVSYAFLTAAILKARMLSPTRSQNFATRFWTD